MSVDVVIQKRVFAASERNTRPETESKISPWPLFSLEGDNGDRYESKLGPSLPEDLLQKFQTPRGIFIKRIPHKDIGIPWRVFANAATALSCQYSKLGISGRSHMKKINIFADA